MHDIGGEAWLLQLLRQHICEIARYAPSSRDSFHGVPKNTSQSAGRLKRSLGV
jgi:hypothetical protein